MARSHHETEHGHDGDAAQDPPHAVDPRVIRTRQDVGHAALQLLLDEGWDAVTQPAVARAAGYSKVTVYAHWPDRVDLLRAAFSVYGQTPHLYAPTGDLRTDVLGELRSFCTVMAEHRVDRALAILAERAQVVPDVEDIREMVVADGERPLREMLGVLLSGPELDSAVMSLCGLVTHSVLLHGRVPTQATLEAAVDRVIPATPAR